MKDKIEINMGLGYIIDIDEQGNMTYNQGDKSMTLVNRKEDFAKLEKAIKISKALMNK